MRATLFLSILMFCALVARPVGADDERDAPRIYAGVYLHDLAELDLPNGRFEADFELWAKWRGDLDPSQLAIANAAEIERIDLEDAHDGDWHAMRWRIRGELRGRFPVQRFPFDTQSAAIVLELPEDVGHLVPDLAASGMASEFGVADWIHEREFHLVSTSETFASDLGMLAHEGRPTVVHRVAFEVRLSRPLAPVLLKLFLPLAIVVLVALIQLFLRPDLIDARSAIGVTALLTTFAFQFTVEGTLPEVSYVTTADALFLVAYIVSTLALIGSVAAYGLHRRQHDRAARSLDRAMQVGLPLATALAIARILPGPVPERPPHSTPMPQIERATSTRDVVRIGTAVLPTILGSCAQPATDWDLVHETHEGDELAFFVSPRPGIDNDALRLMAGGELEISWRIREGSLWSDGEPLRSEDVRLSFLEATSEDIMETEVVDERTFRVRYRERLAAALEGPSPLPTHVVQTIYDEGGHDALMSARRTTPMPTLGPYRVIEFEANDHLIAEANPHFSGEPPAISRVEIRRFADREALVAAFLAGEIDITDPNSITPEQAAVLAQSHPDRVFRRPSSILVALEPDLTHPLLARHDVRVAILRAIDRDRIAAQIYGEGARVAEAPVPEEIEGVTVYRPDVTMARALLEAMGALGIELPLIHDASPVSAGMARLIAEDLEAAGLVIELREVPNTLTVHREGHHGGLLLHPRRGTREMDPRYFWNLPLVEGHYDETRHDAYDDEVHDLVEREERALYPERRDQLRDRLLALVTERLPILPIVFATERVLADPALEGWQTGPEDRFGLGMEHWHFTR